VSGHSINFSKEDLQEKTPKGLAIQILLSGMNNLKEKLSKITIKEANSEHSLSLRPRKNLKSHPTN